VTDGIAPDQPEHVFRKLGDRDLEVISIGRPDQ